MKLVDFVPKLVVEYVSDSDLPVAQLSCDYFHAHS